MESRSTRSTDALGEGVREAGDSSELGMESPARPLTDDRGWGSTDTHSSGLGSGTQELPGWFIAECIRVGKVRNPDIPSKCLVFRDPKARKTKQIREFVVTTLTGRPWREVMAAVPTCGNYDCGEPRHLCVTFRSTD